VQLEATAPLPTSTQSCSFNSILVQLEAAQIPYTYRHPEKFQFHIGAIRSVQCGPDLPESGDEFQFHIGAIRRLDVLNTSARLAGFNSILVQLEAAHQTAGKAWFY